MSELIAANRAAREEILRRVRAGVGSRTSAGTAARAPDGSSDLVPVPAPRPPIPGDRATLKRRFMRLAEASSASLAEVAGLAEVPAAVARYLDSQGLPRRAAAWDALRPLPWLSANLAMEFRAAQGDDAVGITGICCAIAETGTLVVHSGPDTAATTSLLPETHIAVVPESRLVPGMEEAFARILTERGALPRSVNLISGPSRTGDIEQTIVLGAHGPSRVHLILVAEGDFS